MYIFSAIVQMSTRVFFFFFLISMLQLLECEKKTMELLIFETAKNNQVSSARWQKGHICDANPKIKCNWDFKKEGSMKPVINFYSCKNIY